MDPNQALAVLAKGPDGVREWNELRILVTPEKCATWMNGELYYEYVKGSKDWDERVAKSKFASMPLFAKAGTGRLALQGDHGQVSFRNIKIRPLRGNAAQAATAKE